MKSLLLVAVLMPTLSFANYEKGRDLFSRAQPTVGSYLSNTDQYHLACEGTSFHGEKIKESLIFAKRNGEVVLVSDFNNISVEITRMSTRSANWALRSNGNGDMVFEKMTERFYRDAKDYPKALGEHGMVAVGYGLCKKVKNVELAKIKDWWKEYISLSEMTDYHNNLVLSYAKKNFYCSTLNIGTWAPVYLDNLRVVKDHVLKPSHCSSRGFEFCQKVIPAFIDGKKGDLLGWSLSQGPEMLQQLIPSATWHSVKYYSDSTFMVALSEKGSESGLNDHTARKPKMNVSMLIKCTRER
jgi:hypothetical protein